MLAHFKRPIGLIVFLLVWEAISGFGLVSPDYMPRLSTIGGALWDFIASSGYWESIFTTVWRAARSLFFAVGVALLIAGISGRYPLVRRALGPITDILRSLPPPALVPLLILAVGITPKLFFVVGVYGCMWPTYISASNALATAEPVQVNTAKSFGLNHWQIMWQIRIPAALPEIFTGIRLSAGISLLAAVATEMLVGGNKGLGSMIYNAGFSLLWDDMYALMFTIGVIGILFNVGVALIRMPLAGWQTKYAAMGANT